MTTKVTGTRVHRVAWAATIAEYKRLDAEIKIQEKRRNELKETLKEEIERRGGPITSAQGIASIKLVDVKGYTVEARTDKRLVVA